MAIPCKSAKSLSIRSHSLRKVVKGNSAAALSLGRRETTESPVTRKNADVGISAVMHSCAESSLVTVMRRASAAASLHAFASNSAVCTQCSRRIRRRPQRSARRTALLAILPWTFGSSRSTFDRSRPWRFAFGAGSTCRLPVAIPGKSLIQLANSTEMRPKVGRGNRAANSASVRECEMSVSSLVLPGYGIRGRPLRRPRSIVSGARIRLPVADCLWQFPPSH